MRYQKGIIRTGTALLGAAAIRDTLGLLVLGAVLLAILVVSIVAAAAFSKSGAPMARLRGLIRDLRGKERALPQRRPRMKGDSIHLQEPSDLAGVTDSDESDCVLEAPSSPLPPARKGRPAQANQDQS